MSKTGRLGRQRDTAKRLWGTAMLAALVAAAAPAAAGSVTEANDLRDGITFAVEPGALYLPVREIGEGLDWPVRWDAESRSVFLQERAVSPGSSRRLVDGTRLMRLRDLDAWGAEVVWEPSEGVATVTAGERRLRVRNGPKRVVVNRAAQRMRAWQGDRLVLDTHVSTGKPGHETPLGRFRAGPYKARMHRSSLYDNAPMPWSVQVTGNVFIHGFHIVPRRRAASHGCIRVPLTGGNPARWFFEWVDVGTPIRIADHW